MSIMIKDIERETSKVFGFDIVYAESVVLHKEELCPFPIEEKVYDELFNTETVTVLAMANDEDEVFSAVTSEESDWILCIKQDADGEFETVGRIKM